VARTVGTPKTYKSRKRCHTRFGWDREAVKTKVNVGTVIEALNDSQARDLPIFGRRLLDKEVHRGTIKAGKEGALPPGGPHKE
jgi:hypothetical protein